MSFSAVVLVVAVVTGGLLAGVFFVCACAVVPGFRRLDDRTFVAAFRAINRAILNAWFLPVFFAAPVAAVLAAVVTGRPLAAAGAVCAVLTFAVTVGANVPLNTALERAEVATDAGCRTARERFERPWGRWNLVRTVTAVTALALAALAALAA